MRVNLLGGRIHLVEHNYIQILFLASVSVSQFRREIKSKSKCRISVVHIKSNNPSIIVNIKKLFIVQDTYVFRADRD